MTLNLITFFLIIKNHPVKKPNVNSFFENVSFFYESYFTISNQLKLCCVVFNSLLFELQFICSSRILCDFSLISLKATTGYWYVFRLSVRIASFLVWWLPMILRTYLQNFSPRNSFKWEIWPKNLKKSLFFHIHTPTSLFKLQK